jgi:hypothetical protein
MTGESLPPAVDSWPKKQVASLKTIALPDFSKTFSGKRKRSF